MERETLLAVIDAESRLVHSSAVRSGLAVEVQSCPGWSLGDLVWHLAEVQSFWASIIEQRAQDWADVGQAVRPDDGELLDYAELQTQRLLNALALTDGAEAVWTWASDKTVAFVLRRQAHEATIHRWDAERAAGQATSPIDPALASDGIDELLTHVLPKRAAAGEQLGGSVHIHCGDVAGEWTIRPLADGGGLEVSREHAKGDCALRGSAEALLLALWRRQPIESVDVVGDAAVAGRFLELSPLT